MITGVGYATGGYYPQEKEEDNTLSWILGTLGVAATAGGITYFCGKNSVNAKRLGEKASSDSSIFDLFKNKSISNLKKIDILQNPKAFDKATDLKWYEKFFNSVNKTLGLDVHTTGLIPTIKKQFSSLC